MALYAHTVALRAILALAAACAAAAGAAPLPARSAWHGGAAPLLVQDAEPGEAPPAAGLDDPGCAGAIARWRDFAAREDGGGHMDGSVHAKIEGEMARADRLCGAGQDAQARRAVAESKRRHGY